MKLPTVKYQEQLKVTVKLDPDAPNNKLFAMNTPTQVILNPSNLKSYLEGKICPPNGDYEITFLFDSQVVENSRVSIPLTINSDVIEEERFDASWFANQLLKKGNQWVEEGVKRPVLKTDDITTTFDGKLVIKFPAEFVVPEDWQNINQKRNLFEQ